MKHRYMSIRIQGVTVQKTVVFVLNVFRT